MVSRRAAIRQYANQPETSDSIRFKLYPGHAPVLVDHERRGQHRGRPAQPHQAVHHHQPALAARYNTKYYEHLTI